MPRTGTTFLQNKVFPKINGINYYGIPYTHYNQAFQQMMYMDDSLYNVESFKKEINSLEGENILLSNENFIGQSLFFYHSNRTRIAKRLHEVIPNANIILYLRNQVDILKSLYLISVAWKESKSLDDFIWTKREPYTLEKYLTGKIEYGEKEAYYSTFDTYEHLDGYLYQPLIELYKSLFPKVHIVLYEDFLSRPEFVQQQLESIFSIKFNEELTSSFSEQKRMNQGMNKRQAAWLSKINKWNDVVEESSFNSRTLNRLKRWVKQNLDSDKQLDFTEETKALITKFYSKPNQELNKKYPEIGLENYTKEYLL